MAIETELDRLLDAHDYRVRPPKSEGVFRTHRRKALADPYAHPLKRHRLTFRGGLTVDELSTRSTVGASTIRAIEGRTASAVSDATWTRLLLALNLTAGERGRIDEKWIP